jgi:murein DD-endopeptidase MepM/ murein hydrolase activator NlpD
MKTLKFSRKDTGLPQARGEAGRRNKKLLKIMILAVGLTAVVITGHLIYEARYIDQHYLIKPLPAGHPIEIRVDEFGDGHFGAPRGGYRHRGIDLLADIGTPVLACKSGRVAKVDYDKLSGNYIIVAHRDDLTSLYLHLNEVYLREGQRTRQGQIIGTTGNTGNAGLPGLKPHLHFEIRKDGIPQNILNKYELKTLD